MKTWFLKTTHHKSIFKHNIYFFCYKKIETNHNLQTYKKNVDALKNDNQIFFIERPIYVNE
jgi:hypothetical protein